MDTQTHRDNEPPADPADPPFTRSPNLIPVEVLRNFIQEQAQVYGYRGLAQRLRTGHETLRKFVTGRTALPQLRQRELMGAEFLEVHPAGYVREAAEDGTARALSPLKRLLPPDREQAAEVLERIFALAERHPDELPGQAAAVRAWLLRVLHAEFDADTRYPPGRRPRGPSGIRL